MKQQTMKYTNKIMLFHVVLAILKSFNENKTTAENSPFIDCIKLTATEHFASLCVILN